MAVALTDRGRQTHAQALPLWSGLQAQLTTALGSERWGQFLLDLSLIRGLVSGTLPQEDA